MTNPEPPRPDFEGLAEIDVVEPSDILDAIGRGQAGEG